MLQKMQCSQTMVVCEEATAHSGAILSPLEKLKESESCVR